MSVICLHTAKWSNSSISNNLIQHKSFVCTQYKCQTILFDPLIGPYQVLPHRAGLDQGAIKIKGYSAFFKVLALLEPRYQIVLCHIQDTLVGRESYPLAETQSVYSLALVDCAES